ncbi:PucR family transcriptional regulator [Nocardia sp. NPDC058519]|uniref:PucR family transcriptional regulator n=1 Tax=Nocardia sp. NPDC058519 TaxID=3346535 RepID=UPI0036696753
MTSEDLSVSLGPDRVITGLVPEAADRSVAVADTDRYPISDVAALLARTESEVRGASLAEVRAVVAPVAEAAGYEQLPLTPLIHSLFASVRAFWKEATRPTVGSGNVIVLSNLMLNFLEDATSTAVTAHLSSARPAQRRLLEARRELAYALVFGHPVDELSSRAELVVHDRYDLVAIATVGRDRWCSPTDQLAQQRMTRLVRYVVEDHLGAGVLPVFDAKGGSFLLPAPVGKSSRARYVDVVDGLRDSLGHPVVLVELHDVARGALRSAKEMISELCDLAAFLSKPPGAYTLDDLALDYQLTRPSPARTRLAAILAPLRDHPHLMQALQVHLRFGTDRKRVAEVLELHPNTVSYRLRRIAEITGLNPADPAASRILAAAWLASEWQAGQQTLSE